MVRSERNKVNFARVEVLSSLILAMIESAIISTIVILFSSFSKWSQEKIFDYKRGTIYEIIEIRVLLTKYETLFQNQKIWTNIKYSHKIKSQNFLNANIFEIIIVSMTSKLYIVSHLCLEAMKQTIIEVFMHQNIHKKITRDVNNKNALFYMNSDYVF